MSKEPASPQTAVSLQHQQPGACLELGYMSSYRRSGSYLKKPLVQHFILSALEGQGYECNRTGAMCRVHRGIPSYELDQGGLYRCAFVGSKRGSLLPRGGL